MLSLSSSKYMIELIIYVLIWKKVPIVNCRVLAKIRPKNYMLILFCGTACLCLRILSFLTYPWTFHGVHTIPDFLRYHLLTLFPVRGSFEGRDLRACTNTVIIPKSRSKEDKSAQLFFMSGSQVKKYIYIRLFCAACLV